MFGQATIYAMNNSQPADLGTRCDFCQELKQGFYLAYNDNGWLKECEDCRHA